MTIYELTDEYKQLLDMMEDPEIDPQAIADTMEAIQGEFKAKADAYARVKAQLESDMAGIDSEIKRLTELKRCISNNVDRIKESLKMSMEATGNTKFETELFKFSIRKNPDKVIIDDPALVPFEYQVFKEPEFSKTEIKKFLAGNTEKCEWAHLEGSTSVSIR